MPDRLDQAIADGVYLNTPAGRLRMSVVSELPARESVMAQAEQQVGMLFPEAYRAVLRRTDGLTIFDHPDTYYDIRIHSAEAAVRETLELRALYTDMPADILVVASVVYAGDRFALRSDGAVLDGDHEHHPSSWPVVSTTLGEWLERTLDEGYWWLTSR